MAEEVFQELPDTIGAWLFDGYGSGVDVKAGTGGGQSLCFVVVGLDAVVAHASEPGREDVEAEAAQELDPSQCHRLSFSFFPIIFIAKGDFTVSQIEEPVVRDSRFVGIAAEVFDDGFRTGERGFCVDDPGLSITFASPGNNVFLFIRGGRW